MRVLGVLLVIACVAQTGCPSVATTGPESPPTTPRPSTSVAPPKPEYPVPMARRAWTVTSSPHPPRLGVRTRDRTEPTGAIPPTGAEAETTRPLRCRSVPSKDSHPGGDADDGRHRRDLASVDVGLCSLHSTLGVLYRALCAPTAGYLVAIWGLFRPGVTAKEAALSPISWLRTSSSEQVAHVDFFYRGSVDLRRRVRFVASIASPLGRPGQAVREWSER